MKNRREFIKSIGRNSVLTVLGAAAVAGFAFKKINTETKATCPTSPSCKGCGQFPSCKKEQAIELKANKS